MDSAERVNGSTSLYGPSSSRSPFCLLGFLRVYDSTRVEASSTVAFCFSVWYGLYSTCESSHRTSCGSDWRTCVGYGSNMDVYARWTTIVLCLPSSTCLRRRTSSSWVPSLRVSSRIMVSGLPLPVVALKSDRWGTRSGGTATWYLEMEPLVLRSVMRSRSRKMCDEASTWRSTFAFTMSSLIAACAIAASARNAQNTTE
mmetsp:Transcript_23192/g.74625  ORF Transcript_23192/g.74625 Transcript_23192/m.74625 type:complete len:200 (-) Transcript_23192:55-654(-)